MRNNLKSWWAPLLLSVLCLLTAAPQSAPAQDEPTIAKDSLLVTVLTEVCSGPHCVTPLVKWAPLDFPFLVNGPVDAGSRLWVEFAVPGKTPLKFGCGSPSGPIPKGRVFFRDRDFCIPEKKGELYTATGLVPFTIRIRNELTGQDITLFKGKMNVAKRVKEGHVEYYVDQDWRLPIGYIYYDRDSFCAELSFRGSWDTEAYLFYQNKELSRSHQYSLRWFPEYGDARVSVYTWSFPGAGRTAEVAGTSETRHAIPENPGEYEIKVLRGGRLARSVKFTVDANGSFDNGIATANKLGTDRVLVPVKVIGDQDGVWNRLAWKTDAFYGNPLTGFTVPP